MRFPTQPPSGGWCVETKPQTAVEPAKPTQPPSGGWCVETCEDFVEYMWATSSRLRAAGVLKLCNFYMYLFVVFQPPSGGWCVETVSV